MKSSIIIFFLIASIAFSQKAENLKSYCDSLNNIFLQVRDSKIDKKISQKKMQEILVAVRKIMKENDYKLDGFVFPVKNYSIKQVGGKLNNGYIAKGYDFFDGNKHKGHPARDIFIYDKNQDCLDDNSKLPVHIVSASSGIVISSENDWTQDSNLRGGKYIWIYEPNENMLYYYAHNDSIFVKIGQIVNAGDKIANMGRTGLNAYKKRSPTHLHFMCLKLDNNFYPKPVDVYNKLINTK